MVTGRPGRAQSGSRWLSGGGYPARGPSPRSPPNEKEPWEDFPMAPVQMPPAPEIGKTDERVPRRGAGLRPAPQGAVRRGKCEGTAAAVEVNSGNAAFQHRGHSDTRVPARGAARPGGDCPSPESAVPGVPVRPGRGQGTLTT